MVWDCAIGTESECVWAGSGAISQPITGQGLGYQTVPALGCGQEALISQERTKNEMESIKQRSWGEVLGMGIAWNNVKRADGYSQAWSHSISAQEFDLLYFWHGPVYKVRGSTHAWSYNRPDDMGLAGSCTPGFIPSPPQQRWWQQQWQHRAVFLQWAVVGGRAHVYQQQSKRMKGGG